MGMGARAVIDVSPFSFRVEGVQMRPSNTNSGGAHDLRCLPKGRQTVVDERQGSRGGRAATA